MRALILTALVLTACNGPAAPDCAGGVAGGYTIGGNTPTTSGTCTGVAAASATAFAAEPLAISHEGDGGYTVTTHDMPPCPAKLVTCTVTGSCADDAGTARSFDLTVSGSQIHGTLGAAIANDAGSTCTLSTLVNGSR
jgi:hypothetical protein